MATLLVYNTWAKLYFAPRTKLTLTVVQQAYRYLLYNPNTNLSLTLSANCPSFHSKVSTSLYNPLKQSNNDCVLGCMDKI